MITAAVASACVVSTAQAQDATNELEEQGSGQLPTKRSALRTGNRQLEEQAAMCGSGRKASCPSNYSPVCGSNGRTYSNKCQLARASCGNPNLQVAHEGTC